jgi:hypothetical protein
MFKRSIGVATFVVLAPIAALAQDRALSVQPYTFLAPGVAETEPTLHVGAGVDVVHRTGLGVGTELGWVGSVFGFNYGFALLSLTGSYRWTPGDRVVPFANAGVSNLFQYSSGSYWHVGGGVEYWVRHGFGLRVELRDHIPFAADTGHVWGARVGFTFAPGGRVGQ